MLRLGLIAILAPVAFWLALPPGDIESSDYLSFYRPVAQSLLSGSGLSAPDGTPAVRYPPGFPVILALLFGLARFTATSETIWLMGFTLLASFASTLLLHQTFRFVLSERLAQVAAGLWSIYPFALWLTRQPNSEVAFLPLFFGAVFLAGRLLWRDAPALFALGSGGLLGLAALVRPIAIGIPLLLAALHLGLRRHQGRRAVAIAGMLVIGFLIPVAPWEAWVYQKTGAFVPLSTGGPYSLYDGLTFPLESKGYRTPLAVPEPARHFVQSAMAHKTRILNGEGAVFLAEQVRDNPTGVLQMAGLKLLRAWYGTDAQRPSEFWVMLIQALLWVGALGGAWLLWREGARAREWLLFSGLIVAYFWAMASLVLPILRYTVPAVALLFPALVLSCRDMAVLMKSPPPP